MPRQTDMGGFPTPGVPLMLPNCPRIRPFTKGDLWYVDASGILTRLPPGTAGQALIISPTTGLPVYSSVGSLTAPTGTGFAETTAGAWNAAATTAAVAANQVSSFNLTGLTVPTAASFGTNVAGSGTITATDKSDRLQIVATSAAINNVRAIMTTSIVSPPWTIDMAGGILNSNVTANQDELALGIMLADNGTKYLLWAPYVEQTSANNTGNVKAATWNYSNTTTRVSNAPSMGASAVSMSSFFIRITNDTVDLKFYLSPNGKDFTLMVKESVSAFLATLTKFGIGVVNWNANTAVKAESTPGGMDAKAYITHWLVTSSVLGDAA